MPVAISESAKSRRADTRKRRSCSHAPPVFFRPIAFVSDRLINEAGRYLPPAAAKLRLLHRCGNSEVRNAVEPIAGSIQRIDNPTGLRRIALDRKSTRLNTTP